MVMGLVLVGALKSRAVGANPVDNSYSVRVWQAEDGLPENRVVGVVQSPDGFLWVATQGGLVRFDGVRFERINSASSPNLIAGTMRGLLLDRLGRIWLAKEEGDRVFCFEGTKMRMVTTDQGLPKNDRQYSMAVDGSGNLWITYGTGKVVCYDRAGQVKLFTAKDGLPEGGGICWLASGQDGVLWFAKGHQVGFFQEGRFKVLKSFGTTAPRIAPARSGGIWICAGQQVLKYNQGTETLELGGNIARPTRDASGFEPSVLLEDQNGIVWVGTVAAGLYRCDSNAVVRVEVSNPAILSLTEDREGDLWVGTHGGGLNQVHRRVTSLIGSADGLPFAAVQSVCQNAAGALWAVGDNGVLARWQEGRWTVQSPAGETGQAFVNCVAADTNGSVWIGARGGALYRWADGQFTPLSWRDRLHSRSVRALLVTRSGDLWIGTDASDVLYRLRGEELREFALPSGHRLIRAVAEDVAGTIWAGGSDGLLVRITDDALTDETAQSGSASIRCLYGATNGDLWIGYAGAGVGRLRQGQITHFSSEQGLPNDYVAQILTDNRGGIWFAGNQGVFQMREREFDDVQAGRAARVLPVLYGRSQDLPNLQANFDFCQACLRARDGRLYFSMLTGLLEVRPDRIRVNPLPPPVLIERVSVDNQVFADYEDGDLGGATASAVKLAAGADNAVELPPGPQRLQIDFTGLSFVAPENVQFRYQLQGLDRGWVDAGTRRSVQYSHLPPGKYRFQVIACNNDGVWNETGAALMLLVAPHVWETLWFRFSLAVAAAGGLCGSVILALRRRHRFEIQRLEQQRGLERERTRIARDLHDDLGVGLTEIGLLGDLAGTPAVTPEISRGYVHEITGRARDLVALLDEIVWAINPANDTSESLSDYFFKFAQTLLQRAAIRCRLEIVEPFPRCALNAEERHQLFLAFKEALNNVIRHAGATEVHISLRAAEGDLIIRVTDNGHGVNAAAAAAAGSRDGLAGMRERLQRLGGRCDLAAAAAGGTVVTLVIPARPPKEL